MGRAQELSALETELDAVRNGGDRSARCILLRGRRRVGKSRLVEEFVARAGAPFLFYAASGVPAVREIEQFAQQVAESDLPGRDAFEGVTLQGWDAALRMLATALPDDQPSIVVIDELPYLLLGEERFEGILQRNWDRLLSRKPVLLILVGSDMSMMEALNTHGRPFHQRGLPLVLDPLNPAEVGTMLDLKPAEAFDAYLLTGGLPLLCAEWPSGASPRDFLSRALSRPTSALTVSGQLTLLSEFPIEAQAQSVLTAIGSGERTRANIGRAAGDIPNASLDRALRTLVDKRIVAADRPLSTQPSNQTRYRIADPYLRFWLTFIGPHLNELERGRHQRVLDRISNGWTSWRGRAIEPVVRESLIRCQLDDTRLDAPTIGGYWTRTNDVEVDLIGADQSPIAKEIMFVGSIKWLDQRPFDPHDLAELITHRGRVPGADDETPLVVVSRAGSRTDDGVTATYGPNELLAAWRN